MQELLERVIKETITNLGFIGTDFVLEHPKDITHGDYATNVALSLSKKNNINPKELAEKLLKELTDKKIKHIDFITIAGPGFINFSLSKEFFIEQTNKLSNGIEIKKVDTRKVLIEYTDPNPFKPFHIGHLMTNAIGESLARIIEATGSETIRANYQGDVGPHVAKAIYGILQKGKPNEDLTINEKAQYIGECYVYGSNLYEQDESIKLEINTINKKVYDKSDDTINELYSWGRSITLEAFEILYKKLGTKFDYYFFESEMANIGLVLVKEFLVKRVFEVSDGAIIFKAENYNSNLHTRVFVNSQGLPTYETKEIGLTKTKFETINPDISIVVTAIEQKDYMAVATEAVNQINPLWAEKMKHITHGMMRFASGKMSSRLGNVITGESLISDAVDVVFEKMQDRDFDLDLKENVASIVGIGAIKYAILKQAIGGDIIYDEKQALSFEGDSGPYLQYSLMRAKSILEKARIKNISSTDNSSRTIYDIEKILYRYEETVINARFDYAPHQLVGFLIQIASEFNSFYAHNQILIEGDIETGYKLTVVEAVVNILTHGLGLLGIGIPERM